MLRELGCEGYKADTPQFAAFGSSYKVTAYCRIPRPLTSNRAQPR